MLDLACDQCFYIKLKMAVNCCHMTPVLVRDHASSLKLLTVANSAVNICGYVLCVCKLK